ncbi:MAG: hypothetical protein IT438_17105 [Phycisphaerales bacterium]|nr:hypothetical protein [Phycisphaerales bacterium]
MRRALREATGRGRGTARRSNLLRRRRERMGKCSKCGYDLAGLGVSIATCPECGQARSPSLPSPSDSSAVL